MRKIIHIDMDAFYASVEMRDNPKLQNIPMAVGGSSDRRGVLCTANYAARKYGVRSAMPTGQALKLCPHLILVKPNFHKYSAASQQVFKIFREFTDLIEPLSLDEAYLDVTQSPQLHNSATLIAQEIRKKIFEQTKLTASAGISSNKLIAKLASDHKKPNGQFTVHPDEIDDFIRLQPVEKIWGVGKVTAQKLHQLGLKTCLDLQAKTSYELARDFGKFGESLFDFCRGYDNREVETDYERKSLGTEETYAQDLLNFDEMKSHIIRMSQELQESLRAYDSKVIKNIHVKIKYFDFKQTTIERQLPVKEESFLELLKERWENDPRPVRLLGLGVKFASETIPCGQQLKLIS